MEVTRRNLGGLGRTASVFARGSFRGSRFLLNLREPWLFGRKLDSFLTGFWEEENRPDYDFNRTGAIVQTGRTASSRTPPSCCATLYQNTYVYNVDDADPSRSTGNTAPTRLPARRPRCCGTLATIPSTRVAATS